MHCPKCGQQQASQDVRFCSRCGFRLAFVSELIINDGLPVKVEAVEKRSAVTERRRRYKQGAKLMFFSVALLPFAIGLSIVFDAPGPLLIPALMFFLGLFLTLYARLFIEESEPANEKSYLKNLKEKRKGLALPPAQSIAINEQEAQPSANTAEIRQPPSVTENTTKLLDKNSL